MSTTETQPAHQSPPAPATIGFSQVVPRGLAHQRALAEVLITDSLRVGEDEFFAGTQLPRAHSTWCDRRSNYHDPLVTVEAGRQAGFVLAHRYYDVPEGYAFISQQITFEVTDPEAYKDTEAAPLEGLLRIQLADKLERDGALASMSFAGELSLGGAAAKTMSGGMIFLAPGDYKGLREHLRSRKPLEGAPAPQRPRPLDPALVGRRLAQNVVLGRGAAESAGEGEERFTLVVDQRHPCFFDHPQDHVPGPLILEAFRQAALVAAVGDGVLGAPTALVTGANIQFTEFAELDADVECSARVQDHLDGVVSVRLALHQFGAQIAEGELALRECA